MASSSNIGLLRLPWGRLPRSPVSTKKSGANPMEVSFRDIMEEQQRESSQEKDFDEYIQNSYVTVTTPPATPTPRECSEVEKSFMQIEDLDQDLKLVMSFYEDQDFDDATYELTERDIDELEDDDSDKYYEGLAKKLSTVVELQATTSLVVHPNNTKGTKQSRTTKAAASSSSSASLQDSSRGVQSSSHAENAVDPESKVILDKLKQKGILKGTYKPIHVGTSSTVLFASGGMLKRREEAINNGNNSACSILKLRLPKECAVKVFKNTTTNLKTDDDSLEEEQMHVDAKREMAHLNRMTRAGIAGPQVQFLHRNVLVVEFIGKDGVPAKKLRDSSDLTNSRVALKSAYEQITNSMKTLFKTCHLVHGNLSASKILWHKRKPYFINLTTAVNSNRPNALELLYRDCVCITEFFEKKGKPDCRSAQALFHFITGFDFTGQHVDSEQDFAIV